MPDDTPPTHDETQTSLTPLELQERKAWIVDKKHSGWSFRRIGDEIGLSGPRVHTIYWETMREIPAPKVHELREQLIEHANQIREAKHYAFANGELAKGPDGEVLLDDGPALRAIAELRQLEETIAKLNGTTAPVQAVINGTIHYQVAGVDMEKLT
jgi:hypothetical protein